MRNFWFLFFVLALLADSSGKEKKAVEVVGTLGESVTFHLETSEKFTSVSWLQLTPRIKHIALMIVQQPCFFEFISPKLKGRLNVSKDCRDLQITNLHQDDSGGYKAQTEEHEEEFRLKIYSQYWNDSLAIFHCMEGFPPSYGASQKEILP
ncbi:UNVERIFIED_CONTAM: hypothetical protein K2H54_013634 [Gekko kuhli]